MRANAKTTMERILEMEDALVRLEEKMPTMAYKYGKTCREFIQEEVRKQVAEQVFDLVKGLNERDIRIYHLMSQVDSMEKSIKDTNKKITAIRNQLRKEKGRGEL
jgi:hypothetical protein